MSRKARGEGVPVLSGRGGEGYGDIIYQNPEGLSLGELRRRELLGGATMMGRMPANGTQSGLPKSALEDVLPRRNIGSRLATNQVSESTRQGVRHFTLPADITPPAAGDSYPQSFPFDIDQPSSPQQAQW